MTATFNQLLNKSDTVQERFPSDTWPDFQSFGAGYDAGKRVWALLDYTDIATYLPKGAQIVTARITISPNVIDGSGSISLKPYVITSSWSAGSKTWNNKPSYLDVGLPPTGVSFSARQVIDVKAIIQRYADNGSYYGIMLAPSAGSALYQFVSVAGMSDPYYAPELYVEYKIAPTVAAASPKGTSSAPAKITTLTPSLSWTWSSESYASIAYYQVKVIDDATGSVVHDSTKKAGSATSYTVPAGVLAWGKKYRWTVQIWDSDGMASTVTGSQYFETNNPPTVALSGLSSSSGSPTIYQDDITPLISWTFSDTEGDAQKAVNIQILDGSTVKYDSGQIDTTAVSYEIPTSAGLAYNKTYTVKIRAKDARDFGWGSWSASRYFLLNRKPSVSSLTPAGGSSSPHIFHNTITPALSWTFSDPDGHAQSAYDLEIYDLQDIKVHSSGQVSSALKTHNAAGLEYGKGYKWRVRAKDSYENWSDWAAYQYFYTNRDPLKPDLHQDGIQTDPFIINDDLTPSFNWDFFDDAGESQAGYELQLLNDIGTVIYTTGTASGSEKIVTIPYANKLAYDTLYQVRVRVKDNYGQWSIWSDTTWIKAILGAPTGLSANPDNYGAKIYLEWDDSLAEGLQGYNVYRSTDGSSWTKINTSLVTQSSYVDSSIVSDVLYYYAVEAYISDTQISAKSDSATASAVFSAWFIGDFKFEGASAFSKKKKRSRSVKQTLTRRIVQDAGSQKSDISMEIILLDDQESTGQEKYDQLTAELEKTEILSLRDSFGNVWSVTVGDWDDEPLIGTGKAEYKISIELTEV